MYPFEQYELRTVLQAQPAKIQARIDKFTDDEIMANDLKILAHNVCEEFRIDPLELHEEDAERRDIKNGKIQKWFDPVRYFMPDRRGAYREVDGVTLTFVFPFSGTIWLFECQASHFFVRRYLIDVIKMTPVDVKSAIELYEENVGGDMPYISGIEVTFDGATVIEMYLREHPDDGPKGDVPENPASDIISLGGAV